MRRWRMMTSVQMTAILQACSEEQRMPATQHDSLITNFQNEHLHLTRLLKFERIYNDKIEEVFPRALQLSRLQTVDRAIQIARRALNNQTEISDNTFFDEVQKIQNLAYQLRTEHGVYFGDRTVWRTYVVVDDSSKKRILKATPARHLSHRVFSYLSEGKRVNRYIGNIVAFSDFLPRVLEGDKEAPDVSPAEQIETIRNIIPDPNDTVTGFVAKFDFIDSALDFFTNTASLLLPTHYSNNESIVHDELSRDREDETLRAINREVISAIRRVGDITRDIDWRLHAANQALITVRNWVACSKQ